MEHNNFTVGSVDLFDHLEQNDGVSTECAKQEYVQQTSPGDGQFVSEVDICPVCSDKVSGYHYGLQTCESCKGNIFVIMFNCNILV